jgi:hypothetical protein
VVEVKGALVVICAAVLHPFFDREPIITKALEGTQDIEALAFTAHLNMLLGKVVLVLGNSPQDR